MASDDDFIPSNPDVLDADDEFRNAEITINPKFYLHSIILKCMGALDTSNVNDGFIKYIMLVSQMEGVCRACKVIDDTYKTKIVEYKETPEYKDFKGSELARNMNLAIFKFNEMMVRVAETRTLNEAIKL